MALIAAPRRIARLHAPVTTAAAARRRAAVARRTWAIGALALVTTGAVLAGELGRVWRRGTAPLPAETDDVLGAAEEAARQTVEVVVKGYHATSPRETALLNLLLSFTITFGIARASTYGIRARGRFGPFRDLTVGERHIHHFVPGIALALVSGGVSVASRDDRLDEWLAVPFGIGAALTLDESALLLQLDDVYWTEEGLVSVQITLAALALLASLTLALRVLRRGERRVLAPPPAAPAAAVESRA